MKTLRIILIAIFASTSFQLCAQEYNHDTFNYDFYIGTWEYKTPTEQFILKTWYHTYTVNNHKPLRLIRGVFKYTKNGVVIYDNLQLYKTFYKGNYPPVSFMIIEYLSQERNEPILAIDYTDPVTNYDTYILPPESILTLESTNPAVLLWHIVPGNGDDGRARLKPGEIGFTIPSDMILTKVGEK